MRHCLCFTVTVGMRRDDLITQVLMPIAEELNLPIAFKFGAMRAVNPSLRTGQDGVEVADVGSLRRLCTDFPRVTSIIYVVLLGTVWL